MKIPILSAENIGKTFHQGGQENIILNNLSIKIYSGDFTVIMGSSGAGKSTFLYTLSGMDSVTKGKVYYKGKEMGRLKAKEMARLRAEDFGFVFQQNNLVSNLSLYENVLVAGFLDVRQKTSEVREHTEHLMKMMHIGEERFRMPAHGSGGEAQRTAIARAMVGNPEILFADEPTGALNRKNSEVILDILTELNEQGQTILMVTHDIHAAIRGSRVLYMENGDVKGEYLFSEMQRQDDKKREEDLSRWLTQMHW
ncbi:MAG: ABC transporter ATP-binding protein [Lachnospiraceae bacterium]|nr:ABC transporter ATP-binding protein [Lachnospiraceae bacterium]